MSFNPAELQHLGTGMIVMWGGSKNNIPAGWFECDGTLLSTADYANLYSVIGVNFGATPLENQFYLPDLRGQFIRGVDDGSGTDPDTGSRTDMQNGTPYSGVGSIQQNAMQAHSHYYNDVDKVTSNALIDGGGNFGIITGTTTETNGANTSPNETRPVNAYLYYIIKS